MSLDHDTDSITLPKPSTPARKLRSRVTKSARFEDTPGEPGAGGADEIEVEEVSLASLFDDSQNPVDPNPLDCRNFDPESTDVLFAKAVEHQDRGELDLAAECFERLLEIDSSIADAHNNLGMVYLNKGMTTEGIRAFEETLKLDPQYAEAYSNLGFAHRRMGKETEAADFYSKYLDLNPNAEDGSSIRTWLDSFKAASSYGTLAAGALGSLIPDQAKPEECEDPVAAILVEEADNIATVRAPEAVPVRCGDASEVLKEGEVVTFRAVTSDSDSDASSPPRHRKNTDPIDLYADDNTSGGTVPINADEVRKLQEASQRPKEPHVVPAPEKQSSRRTSGAQVTPRTVVYRAPFEEPQTIGTSTVPAAKKVTNTQFGRLAGESGLVSQSDIQVCNKTLEQVLALGLNKTLADVMVERGFLTVNQATAIAAAARSGDAGGLLGGFQLLDKLGEGGMGAVYKARQVSLDRLVALKIMSPNFAADREFVARFEREAKTAAQLAHPNIVGAVDVGKAAGKYYFAMEYIDGKSVKDVLDERSKIPVDEAVEILMQMAKALNYAWAHNMIHRDIKPDNIMITAEGQAKLADLGLAKQVSQAGTSKLTRAGAGMGTPHYIAPEQALGNEVDIRADIYSLGVTFYEMVCGELPFKGKDAMAIIMGRFKERPAPADEINPNVSRNVADVIDVMMAHEADDRYPDPRVLLHDLVRVAEGKRPEYASRSETMRVRAVKNAETMDLRAHTSIVVRRRSPKGLIAMGLLVTLAAAGFGALYYYGGGNEIDETKAREQLVAIEAERAKAEAERLEKLTAEAGTRHAELQKTLEAGDNEKLVAAVAALGQKYGETKFQAELQALKLEAGRRIDEAKRLAAAQVDKDKRHATLVKLAQDEIKIGDYTMALGLLGQAAAIKKTELTERLVRDTKRAQHITRAQDAERAGRSLEAIRLYELALEISADAKLRGRVDEIRRKVAFGRLIAAADSLIGNERWQDAKAKLAEARAIARGAEKADIESKSALVETELRYEAAIERATEAADAKSWENVLKHAKAALSIRSDDAAAQDLIAQAKEAMGPEPEFTNSLGMKLVLVPAGEFIMGSDEGDEDEKPARTVSVGAYYIARTEVTNAQFEAFRPGHRSKWKQFSAGDNMPAIAVTWEEAAAFCKWLSGREGVEYRLPTEAQWEYAARGSDARLFPWGSEPASARGDGLRCNFAPSKNRETWSADGYKFASPVGSYQFGASPHGCHDMAGNVWEWCSDWYAPDYYANGPTANPAGPVAGQKKVLRGGSFTNQVATLRCSNRLSKPPHFYEANVGFRLVRVIEKRSAVAANRR